MTWFDRIIPPDDPKKLATWRLCIAAAVILLLANGYIGRAGVWGFGSYAYADDVAEQTAKIDRVLELQIAQILPKLQEEMCRTNGNKDALRSTIEKYQSEYRELTGERYPLTPCEGENS